MRSKLREKEFKNITNNLSQVGDQLFEKPFEGTHKFDDSFDESVKKMMVYLLNFYDIVCIKILKFV